MADRSWSARSLKNLQGIHPKLRVLADRALQLSPIDFVVLEGLRSEQRQRALVASGASRTMNSRHLHGLAIDVAPLVQGQIRWDWPLFHQINRGFAVASQQTSILYKWGGNWSTFPDGPHFELQLSGNANTPMTAGTFPDM